MSVRAKDGPLTLTFPLLNGLLEVRSLEVRRIVMQNAKKVTLRMAEPQDDDFLVELYTANRRSEMRMAGPDAASINALLRSQYEMRKKQYDEAYPNSQNWIILYDHEPIGRHLIQPDPRVWAFIDLGILPEFQRQGIGTLVFKLHMQQAIDAGAAIRLHVRTDNPARRIYERLGFVTTEQDGVYDEMRFGPPPKA